MTTSIAVGKPNALALPLRTPATTIARPGLEVLEQSASGLIGREPMQALLLELHGELEMLNRLAPHSDARSTLESLVARLGVALRDASEANVWVTTDEAAELRGVHRSTVLKRIQKKTLAADWRGGRWWIHRRDVERI